MRKITGKELINLPFGEEVKIVWTATDEVDYAVIFGSNMGFKDGSVKNTMIMSERERRGECEIYLMSEDLVPMDSLPDTFNIKFVLDNGAVNLETDAIVIAMNAPSAIVKLQNYVNHLDSETCCKRITDIKVVDAEEVLLFHH